MKIIFCDIDGVLNSEYYARKHDDRFEIEERKVKNLKKIVDATGAEVVIVSHLNSFMGFQFDKERIEMIRNYGVFPIESLTINDFFVSKEEMVKRWVIDNDVDKYVIIDDHEDNYETLLNHLVAVKGKHGLTNTHIKEAIKILNK